MLFFSCPVASDSDRSFSLMRSIFLLLSFSFPLSLSFVRSSLNSTLVDMTGWAVRRTPSSCSLPYLPGASRSGASTTLASSSSPSLGFPLRIEPRWLSKENPPTGRSFNIFLLLLLLLFPHSFYFLFHQNFLSVYSFYFLFSFYRFGSNKNWALLSSSSSCLSPLSHRGGRRCRVGSSVFFWAVVLTRSPPCLAAATAAATTAAQS